MRTTAVRTGRKPIRAKIRQILKMIIQVAVVSLKEEQMTVKCTVHCATEHFHALRNDEN